MIINQTYPSLIKYMGSKSKIMDFVLDGINEVHDSRPILDLFAGSASIAGAVGQQAEVHSNDIQSYSAVLSRTYNQYTSSVNALSSEQIINSAMRIVEQNRLEGIPSYDSASGLEQYQNIEVIQQGLIDWKFDYEFHLFARNYSGTWWSYDQCLWIDAIREIAEDNCDNKYYDIILSALMFSMAYASQGTGHYAQFRDAKDDKSLKDIQIYRSRSIVSYFVRKFDEICAYLPKEKVQHNHKSTALDYQDCLNEFSGGTVYADPPYCFVHYSRFYHALETLVLYDFPELQRQKGAVVKGRYRDQRHQSPFCIKSKVPDAFDSLARGIFQSGSSMVLSYSNTGMIDIESIIAIAETYYGAKKISVHEIDHAHMTMGRREDRSRKVRECLVIGKA